MNDKVKRYTAYDAMIKQEPAGRYVEYADYAALEAECERWRRVADQAWAKADQIGNEMLWTLWDQAKHGGFKAVLAERDEARAALSALDEREAARAYRMGADVASVESGFVAGAAWQRAQSAPVVPEGELPWTGEQLARAWYLAEYGPGHDLAPGYAVAFARELAAMLAAAPQPVARQVCPACKGSGEGTDMGDPGEVACMCNGSGEIGADPAAQDQGEVRRLREALEEIRRADMNAPVSESNAGCIKRIKQIAERALFTSAEGKV